MAPARCSCLIRAFCVSQGGAVAIAYASRHPERLSHLIIYGAFARRLLHRENPEKKRDTGKCSIRHLSRASDRRCRYRADGPVPLGASI
jgi:pimeloyl-ACP methyl ester carboxylesterase